MAAGDLTSRRPRVVPSGAVIQTESFHFAYQGTITVLGRDLRDWDRNYYRRIGVAFEAPNPYLKLTARENLRLFAGLHSGQTEAPDALLRRVGLEADGDKRVGEFSKGMRGRLTLARARLHRPELLFQHRCLEDRDPPGHRLAAAGPSRD